MLYSGVWPILCSVATSLSVRLVWLFDQRLLIDGQEAGCFPSLRSRRAMLSLWGAILCTEYQVVVVAVVVEVVFFC